MKVTFYYVRHGQTIFNTLGRLQGMCDSPLTRKGIQDAQELASVLRNIHFDHVYASSSERAWKTADIICQYHKQKPVLMKELREFDFGDLDGKKIDDFQDAVWGEGMREDWSEFHGETMHGFARRSKETFASMVANCEDGDNVLVVSHGSYIMHLMRTLLNFDQKAYIQKREAEGKAWIPNCGICVFSYMDGMWQMEEEPVSAQEFRQLHFPKTVQYYLVRHGETQFNVQHRLQGQCDSPLTENGIVQVQETAKKLQKIAFDCCYTSTSERTRDTADILLCDKKIPVKMDARLKEINFGMLEGSNYLKNLEEQNERFYNIRYADIGGEDASDVKDRIRTFLRDVTDASKDGDVVLLVSHANLYTVLLEELFEIDRKELYEESHKKNCNPTPNGGVCHFAYENGKWILKETMDGEVYES